MQHGQRARRDFVDQYSEISMVFGLFKKKNNNRVIVDRQYAALTTAARQPGFYLYLNVPDTVMGRFELLAIVMILYFRRTKSSQTSGQEIAQEIIDAFFQDLDHSMRELGIGDQGVPKRMKKFAGMFYGRLESYAAALDGDDVDALAAALARNIYPQSEATPADMRGLATWMMAASDALTAQSEDLIATGQVTLPTPDFKRLP
ncbi:MULTISPECIES: ubiquinol-cytochrome C chaperone family protein [Rhizobium/Agrobacterium group]|uniref:ubiquinol-cytochrome C chaperone family protein n=1 Tax=Rhizobium/Agrobacterium group TaxID=227290 RepID=UPI000715410F|nr:MULTISPECIES: ubiquinol-cytochrome C chaperone family protein [Rhizobium/Agrobacterium group]KQQ59016.1 ubiquinol-cytochrome C chaperone [Rhizobium sp. Leaf311]